MTLNDQSKRQKIAMTCKYYGSNIAMHILKVEKISLYTERAKANHGQIENMASY